MSKKEVGLRGLVVAFLAAIALACGSDGGGGSDGSSSGPPAPAPAPGPGPSPSPSPSPSPGDGMDGATLTYPSGHPLNWLTTDTGVLAREDEVLTLVNDLRASLGKGALTMHTTMRRCARGHSKHMTADSHGFFDHVNPEGDGPSARLTKNGMSGGAGENIAAGYSTARAAFDAWVASPGHYANIVGSYTKTGVGYQAGPTFGHYWTQMFQ